MSTDVLIDVGKAKNRIRTDTELARRLGMSRQTFHNKRLYPGTFTTYELSRLAKTLSWSAEEIEDFLNNIE